ncbi:ubiquitin-associated and SH3 domain-containing protein A-like [Pristis pectinata]|uniref:ubiquitin-associated and SH3 domain-containing protein A-like n=1 Tax=Pristis pectinata TaxID=685728 RepID=UPI00223CBF38|nr:ubiquitin-associated and SH3 domain-containing protein A-like [Pristis pectinata]
MAECAGRPTSQCPAQLQSRSTPSLLEPLLAQGFPEHLVQKALAATGRAGPQEASDWIRAHGNDPTRDDPIPQEYVLYLCPSAPLWDQLLVFWAESQKQCGRNRAHELFPHISLCHFFTCEDSKLERLYEALKKTGDRFVDGFPSCLSLTLHTSSRYIGFFLDDASADVIKQFALAFREAAAKLADCQVEVSSNPLHLTLSHRFLPEHQRELEARARAIGLGVSCQWTVGLYSRDMRFVHYQVLQALYPYSPQNEDELKLDSGDYIFLHPTEQAGVSQGWVFGTSHRTGCRGLLPENYTETASESNTWVSHRSYTFGLTHVEASGVNGNCSPGPDTDSNPMPNSIHRLLEAQLLATASSRRWLLFLRHGERVDLVFGKAWMEQCFSGEGRYIRTDLNFPHSVPQRAGGTRDYEHDAPLSSCGIFQSRLMGEAMTDREVPIRCVYSSPALRCVQTAHHLLQGLKPSPQLGICVEPGLFEWTKWEAAKSIPNFMSVAELKAAGYSVDGSYRAHVPITGLIPSETYEDYVSRCSTVIRTIVNSCPEGGGNILLVGHASTLDCCSRPITGTATQGCQEICTNDQKDSCSRVVLL